MTLRVRLAVGAALLVAVSATLVASISYFSTEQRLHSEVQKSLTDVLSRFNDPDGRLVASLCQRGVDTVDNHDDIDAGLLGGAPGINLQCRDANNVERASVGPVISTNATACGPSPVGAIRNWGTQGPDDASYEVASVQTSNGYCIVSIRSLIETKQALASIRNRSMIVGLVVMIGAALIGLVAARRATRPIRQLTESAERIAATNDFDVDLPPDDASEVGRLSAAFRTMLASLRRSQEQQQQLVQDAGHELRTPLTSIRTNIDTLARYSDLDSKLRDDILRDLKVETEELSSLVSELVLLSGESGDDLPTEDVDLNHSVTDVVERWRRRSGRQIELTESGNAVVVARPTELARAVSNLIDNALKFSPTDAAVEVSVQDKSVTVRDHGAGINEADSSRLFDRFHRAVDARSLPGSGLGLAIVAEVAKRQGGTVAVGNHPDGGAVFILTFS